MVGRDHPAAARLLPFESTTFRSADQALTRSGTKRSRHNSDVYQIRSSLWSGLRLASLFFLVFLARNSPTHELDKTQVRKLALGTKLKDIRRVQALSSRAKTDQLRTRRTPQQFRAFDKSADDGNRFGANSPMLFDG